MNMKLQIERRVLYSLAAVMAVVGVTLAAQAVRPAKRPPAQHLVVTATTSSPAPKPKKLDPRDAWAAAVPRMLQADRESIEAAHQRLETVKQYLEERKRGARPFAEAVLNLKGKALYTAGLAAQAGNAIGEVFGASTSPSNGFNLYVRDCYREHVIGETRQLQKVIDDATAGYAGDVKAIEAQLLVDLRSDLADDAVHLKDPLPGLSATGMLKFACDQAVARAVEDAGSDFAAMIVSGAVSWVAGDVIGNQFISENDSAAKKLGVNVVAGAVVDQAIAGAMAQAGYDPVAKVAAKAVESLDLTCNLLIESYTDVAPLFPRVLYLSIGHPNNDVRLAFVRAVEAMESSPSLGLRARLYKRQFAQSRQRTIALYSYLFGPNAEVPDELIHPPIPLDGLEPDSKLILNAEKLVARFGGKK
jgi:hypothetical protein